METTKTELLQKYLVFVFDTQEETGIATNEQIFEWFWKEIEFWQKSFEERTNDFKNSEDKISRLESTLEAADEVINNFRGLRCETDDIKILVLEKALKKYNQLKSNLK